MPVEDCLREGIIRHEAKVDPAKLREFQYAHNVHTDKKSPDPIFKFGDSFLYKPSTCGAVVEIICECGEKSDITDYSNW